MRPGTQALSEELTTAPVTSPLADALLGYFIASICPALFWTLALALSSEHLGFELGVPALAGIAGAVALFLGFVFSAVRARAS